MDEAAKGKAKRRPNPRGTANFLSKILFLYTFDMFKIGYKREILESDLYEPLPEFESKKLGDRAEEEWNRTQRNKKKQKRKLESICGVLLKIYGPKYLFLSILKLFYETPTIVIRPIVFGKLISYFTPGQTDITKREAWLYALAGVSIDLFGAVFGSNFMVALLSLSIRIRASLCSLMYRKILQFGPEQFGDFHVGKIVTLMTRDIDAVEVLLDWANDSCIGILKVLISGCFLYHKIGLSAVVGLAVFVSVLPLQVYLGFLTKKLRVELCGKADERLRLSQEVFSAIKIIKLYTWESVFSKRIADLRKKELSALHRIFLIRFGSLVLGSFSSHAAFYCLMMSYIWMGHTISAEMVYYVIACFQMLKLQLTTTLPLCINTMAEFVASGRRIEKLLNSPGVEEEGPRDGLALKEVSNGTGKPWKGTVENRGRVTMRNVAVTDAGGRRILLQVANLDITRGVTVVSGAVGSGKSLLIKAILRECPGSNVTIAGRVSYASQQPWVFPASIRQNIVFGEDFDDLRYQKVLEVCALIYDLRLMQDGDATIVEDRGINLSKGQQVRINLARAVYRRGDIYLLDDSLASLDANIGDFVYKECVQRFLKGKVVVFATNTASYAGNRHLVLEEGRIVSDTENDLQEQVEGHEEQIVSSSKIEEEDEKLPIDEESDRLLPTAAEEERASKDLDDDGLNDETRKRVYKEGKKGGKVDYGVYWEYVKFGGGPFALLAIFGIYASAQFAISYTDKLVSQWVNFEEKNASSSTSSNGRSDAEELVEERLRLTYTYTLMTAATMTLTLLRAAALLFFCRTASRRIHKRMIETIVKAEMRFFDTHFVGNILNRFSRDLSMMDEFMPYTLYSIFPAIFSLAGIVILFATVNTYFLVPTVIVSVALVGLRACYLRTGRPLRRLEGIVKSPLVGYVNATVEGVTTIRAFQKQNILRREYDVHQDLYNSVSFNLPCYSMAFVLAVNSLCIAVNIVFITVFLISDGDTPAGDVGLALSQAFMMTGDLQQAIRDWANMETLMTAVERVFEYTKVPQEDPEGTTKDSRDNWPEKGEIKFEGVNLTYPDSSGRILKDLDLTIKPAEKIAIIGRTGAGKSSIISTLLRLYNFSGTISIDGTNTKDLSLEQLRSGISVIPQDPVMFTGTLRSNIDPAGLHDDGEIWRALDSANLRKILPESPGLDGPEIRDTLSTGQKQLICIARATVRRNRIVILDEATANLDRDTEDAIAESVKKNFAECTVITIAHKLRTVLESDRILVLDGGEIVEAGTPGELLRNEHGVFCGLLRKSGHFVK